MNSLINAATRLLDDLRALIAQSRGVDGLHLNGDLATWEELLPGGRYEEWLGSRDDLDAELVKTLRLRGVEVVCICGSTRFADTMNREAERLTLEGKIVVRPEVVAYSRERDQQFVHPDQKAALDELHKRKIDLADSVFVVNVGGYVGSSTRGEIEYATLHQKPITYLEPLA